MTKKITCFTLFLFCLLGKAVLLQAQSPLDNLKMEMFELPNGELGNHVQAIAQDQYGFMWFGSQYGLHRWDGRHFKTYLHNPSDPNSIGSNYIEYILVARDGSLWLGFWGGGMDHFQHETGNFTHYTASNWKNSLSDDNVSVILEDRKGMIWIGTLQGLDRLDPKTGEFTHYKNKRGDDNSLSDNQVRALYEDSEGTLWVGTGFTFSDNNKGGLNRFHPESGTFTRYMYRQGDPNALAGPQVRAMLEDSKGNFWVGTTGDGLQKLDRNTGKITQYPSNRKNTNLYSAPPYDGGEYRHVSCIFEDKSNFLWIADFSSGFKVIDPATGTSKLFQQGDRSSKLIDNAAWTVKQSKDGVLWFSTALGDARVYRIVQRPEVFKAVVLPTKQGFVSSFSEDKKDNLWVATQGFSVGKMALDDEKKGLQIGTAEQEQALAGATKIVADDDGTLWVVKADSATGLIHFDPKNKTVERYYHDKGDPNSLVSNFINDIVLDKKGNLWVATEDGGLDYFDKKNKHFQHFRSQKGNANSLTHNHLDKLFEGDDGKLWIVGSGNKKEGRAIFVNRFDPQQKAFTNYNLNGVPNEKDIWQSPPTQDKEGNIWLCLENGILKLVPITGTCVYFGSTVLGKDALPLKGLELDDEGKLWVMGQKLLRFDPDNETVFAYQLNDGLKSHSFQKGAIYKNEKGEIFLGGQYGFHYFNPDVLGDSSNTAPVVRITDFELLDQSEQAIFDSLQKVAFWKSGVLQLDYNQNVFAFRFAAMDFTDPEDNRLEFMLENFDKTWRVADQEPKATYIKVPPGRYRFRVRGANSLGIWGEETALDVVIHPPVWMTWWAYLLYFLLIGAVLYAVYRFYLDRRLEQAETQRLKELDVMKNRLYANITHEFRTPLTIIMGMAKQVKENPGDWFSDGMDMISRNGENLLGLVNQMLDLSKLESGNLPIRYIQGDVVQYLGYIVQSFHSYAESRGIQLHFLSDPDELVMDYDPDKLKQVVTNLISNAVKFTPESGNVYVSTSCFQGDFIIKIKDTGIGIAEEQLPYIFDRFYQVDGSSTRKGEGTGIGLSLAKELIHSLDGKIYVKSRPGKGTEFQVHLPIRNLADLRMTNDDLRLNGEANTKVDLRFTNNDLRLKGNGIAKKAAPAPIDDNRNSSIVNRKSEDPLILIIEDNADVVAYLATCLDGAYKIAVAKDGEEGIDLATQLIPDLIISDVMMPQKDGFEVCRFLKNDERTSHIPIIILTAKADLDSKLEGLEHGADAYLAKPFHREELLVRIKNLLSLRQKLQQHYLALAGTPEVMQPSMGPDPAPMVEDYFVKKVRRAVEAHLDDYDFNVEALCRAVGMSHSQLHRKLTAVTGLSANKFIRYIRLNKAKELLQDPDTSISAVAFDTGFNDPSYFGRVFKQEFGMTPVEWREGVGSEVC
ncbi:MAG: helix-turn-helix domain-containing protein [Lewinellaceae bacterium]|nr:helix-turn-helix domain-containing protein [Lewinellaceae bacterium]